jgi:uncharacterized protein (TIGR02246 family)
MTTGQADVSGSLRALDEEFVRNANAGDAGKLVSGFYTEDATLLPPNAPLVRGADNIRGFWQGVLDAGAGDVTLETTQVDASGDLAYGVGRYSFTMPAEGGERGRDRGKYLVVFRRQADGSWRCVADMFSSDQAPA